MTSSSAQDLLTDLQIKCIGLITAEGLTSGVLLPLLLP